MAQALPGVVFMVLVVGIEIVAVKPMGSPDGIRNGVSLLRKAVM